MTTTSVDPPVESFPRQSARTRHFRLGAPRSFSVSSDGRRVVLLRSDGGSDPINALRVLDVVSGEEHVAADPVALLGGVDEDVPAAERARRERMRETTSGITAYSTDEATALAAFALSGRLFVAPLDPGGAARELAVPGPVVDPRVSPDGRWVSFVVDGAVHLVGTDGAGHRVLRAPESDTVCYGLADFIAAEELERSRGLWWSPVSDALIVERADESQVPLWWVSDPAHPESEPVPHRYPAAGSPNPSVALHLVHLDGSGLEIVWDHERFEYLVSVSWQAGHDPLVTVLSRDQREMRTFAVDPRDGTTRTVLETTDEHWVEVVTGQPEWSPRGQVVHTIDEPDTRRLAVDGHPITPPGLQVRSVLDVDDRGVLVTASEDPTTQRVVHVDWDGTLTDLTPPEAHSSAVTGGGTLVSATSTWQTCGTTVTVSRPGVPDRLVRSLAEAPDQVPEVTVLLAGEQQLRTAVLFPRDHVRGSRRLPVLMSPYGGPHFVRVVAAGLAFAEEQWLADQGFVVVVADGRGTPGRGPAWDRAVAGDLATAPLADQVAALDAVAAAFPGDVDTSRVAIRGWSFGGFLAALAVLRRPDVFHAAVAGAPVTNYRRYDTAYTERYLGHPDEHPENYDGSNLLVDAPGLSRPLMLIHGLADDNVVVAHTLELSGELMAAGRPHTVLPLTGVTHMTPQVDVAENLLRLQVAFLAEHLGA